MEKVALLIFKNASPSIDSCSNYEYIKNFQPTVYFKVVMHSYKLFGSYRRNHKPVRNLKKNSLGYFYEGLSTCIQIFKQNDNVWIE